MGIAALATAGYAYLIGPVMRSLFSGSTQTRVITDPSDLIFRVSETLNLPLNIQDSFVIGLAIIVLAGIKGASHFGNTAISGRAGQRVLHKLRVELYHGLLSLNPLHYKKGAPGDLVARFTVDLEAVHQALIQGIVKLLRDSMQIIALAALAISLDPMLALLGFAVFPPVAVLIIRIGRRVRRHRADVHATFGNVSAVVEETRSGLAVIKGFGAETFMGTRFAQHSAHLSVATVRAILLKAVSSPFNEMLGALALALTLWYAHHRIHTGSLTPESFISFFSALFLLYQPIKGIGQAQHAIQEGLAALDRLSVLRSGQRAPGIDPEIATVIARGPSLICLTGVETGYDHQESVIKNVDLSIPTCSRIALIGPSGAGKSTLIHLLQGFLPARQGTITVDGHRIDGMPWVCRRLFAPVPQEPYLFDDTIRMNVRCGHPNASDLEIERACQIAGVTQFTRGLAAGLESQVGPGGKMLSLGQRQRVCLARALVSPAPILLLDEVTACLDGETEHALIARLASHLEGRTVIMVTHRLSTAKWADRIVLVEHGTAQEVGTPDQHQRVQRLFGAQAFG